MKNIYGYTYAQATDLFAYLPVDGNVVMDLGAGIRDNPISKQIAELDVPMLISIENFEPYIEILKKVPVQAQEHLVIQLSVLDAGIVPNSDVVMLDVIEHLEKEQALEFIKKVQASARSFTIFTPEGDTVGFSNHHMDNPLQEHLSAWSGEELEELGFEVTVFKGFHHHVKSFPVGGLWATWRRK
jgi:hypothetical protein